jgi:hypothetical protein
MKTKAEKKARDTEFKRHLLGLMMAYPVEFEKYIGSAWRDILSHAKTNKPRGRTADRA